MQRAMTSFGLGDQMLFGIDTRIIAGRIIGIIHIPSP
jgi:hypothetical protein